MLSLLSIEERITDDIYNIIPKDIIDEMESLGQPINGGNTPPAINGTYKISPVVLKASNFNDGFPIGHVFADTYLTLSEQNNGNLTVKLKKAHGTEESEGVGAYIIGQNEDFTVFVEFNTTDLNTGIKTKTVEIYSGTMTSSGIKNCFYSLVMTNDGGDPYNTYIDIGQGRLIWDSDGFSEKIVPEQIKTLRSVQIVNEYPTTSKSQ